VNAALQNDKKPNKINISLQPDAAGIMFTTSVMQSPASKLGRKRGPSLTGIIAMMGGFFLVFAVLAELASATTNDQPAAVQPTVSAPAVTQTSQPSEPTPAPVASETPAVARPNSLCYGATEIVKMFQGGVKADVLLTYIETGSYTYQLSSKEILYLNQIGVPSEIVNAMIRRDHALQLAQADKREQVAATVPSQTDAGAYVQPIVVVQPTPAVKYVSARNCSKPICAATSNPNVTVIGNGYNSSFYNGCYAGPFSCSPARAYFNYQFGSRYLAAYPEIHLRLWK
jgi:hypothetical protein